jgi:tetratricopeptide (TPR) repeat protein
MGLWFWVMCAYGVVWAVLFALKGETRGKTVVHLVYLAGFAALGVFMSQGVFSGVGSAGGSFAVIGAVLFGLGLCMIPLLFNAVPMYLTMLHFIGAFGRGVAGLDQVVYTKTYDKASGAEARGEFGLAADLYRKELAQDPKDLEARRRLAEALVRAGRPEEAVTELRRVMEATESREQRHAMAFRLAELLGEDLKRPGEAEALYRLIIQEEPQGKRAQYARARLAGGAADEAPTDF